MHRLTMGVDEGVHSEVFLEREPPAQPFWTRSFGLSQEHKHSSQRAIFRTRRQQAKISNRVAISIWDVFSQVSNEVLERTPGCYAALLSLVLRRKLDFSVRHF